jgi:FixJ family two-component response regulator
MSQAPPTIILVDDDESFCRAMNRLLRSAGYDVRAFASAEAFLAELPADEPGCLLLDVQMPGLDGLHVQTALNRSGQAWPIVFLTGHSDIPTSVRAMKAGAVDFITKPFEELQLLQAIDQALARDAAERATRAEREALERRVGLLTMREYEVFCWVVTGLANKQIAARLGTTEKTIKVHRSRVMEKLEAGSLADLVQFADRLGIPPPPAPAAQPPCAFGRSFWSAAPSSRATRSAGPVLRRARVV